MMIAWGISRTDVGGLLDSLYLRTHWQRVVIRSSALGVTGWTASSRSEPVLHLRNDLLIMLCLVSRLNFGQLRPKSRKSSPKRLDAALADWRGKLTILAELTAMVPSSQLACAASIRV